MKTGFAKIEITPPLGSNLNGYYRERYADHIIEPLYVTAVAYSDRKNTALTISLDISEILQRDTNEIRKKVSEHTGLPFEAVFMACIHTHTAPVISEIRGFFKRDEEYYNEFCEKICRCSAEAIADLKDSVVSIARGKAEGYFPTDEALNTKGYESSSALFLPGVAPELINTSLDTLKELKEKRIKKWQKKL